jgi:hypothetical protein
MPNPDYFFTGLWLDNPVEAERLQRATRSARIQVIAQHCFL